MSVNDLNTFFVWQRASGTPRPIGHFLSDVSGVKFSDIVLDSLNKSYNDLDGNTDGLNFSSYVFDANTDTRTRGCDGKVSSNDLVMAYILYKCYGSSTCPTANVIYNLEDAQAMLSSGAVSMSITSSFEEDEQLANLGGVNLGEVDAMFRNMLASAPLRYFQANGTQIPGLFETNYVCPPSDPAAQGSWQFMENDILEVRMSFAFQQPVAHESIDSVGTQSSNTVIKAGDTFSIRLQILATDTHSSAAAKAASSAAAIAAAAAASATAQQQAAANAMLAAASAQQAVNSAAAQQQADAAQLQLILTNHAQQQINVNNVAYVYGAAEASLTAAIVSGQAQSITQQTRANALAAAATLTQNQAVLANLSTQLVQTKMKYDASVSTLAGSQTIAAAALLTSANAANMTAAAALAAAQAAVLPSTISDNDCSVSTLQIQMLLSNAINPTLLLSNEIAFNNASNASLSIWQSALMAQAKEVDAKSMLTNAQQVMNMAIVLGDMANIQIMMANVNAYTTLEAKAKANLLSTNMALIGAAATEYTAYTTLLNNSNTAANLSNLLALSKYNEASRALSTTVLNVSSIVSSDSAIQSTLVGAQGNLNSSIAGGTVASENTLLTSSFVGYTTLATSSSAAVTRITASSNLAQLLVNSMNSNVLTTGSNLATITSNNSALLSTFSTSMTLMMNYEQSVLANPSTIQSAQKINTAHITYNTILEKKELASNALTVAQRILNTAIANQAPPQQIALLQGNVTEAQNKLTSAELALNTALNLYNSATVLATEDPNAKAILTLAASTMTASISTALHNQLATNLYSAVSTQNSLTTVLNNASLSYTLAQGALANAITAGKTISEIQVLNSAVDVAKAAYSRATIAASAASVAVSTAQVGVTADPSTMSILESASLISYSTTQGALAAGLVKQVTALYEGSVLAAQDALTAQLNYSTSVAALVSAVAGGAFIFLGSEAVVDGSCPSPYSEETRLHGIERLQRAVNSTSVVYAKATRASIQAGTALIEQQRVASVNPLAKAILDTTSVNLAAASISKSVQTYGAALVDAKVVTASTLVAMGSAQTAYTMATSVLDTEIARGNSLAEIQRAQSTLQAAGSFLAERTVAYNNSLSTLTQTQIFFSTSTDSYTSTLSQANVSPLSDSIAVVTAEVAGIVVALSTQTAAIQNQEVAHLASIAYETQVSLVSSIAGLSTISSITQAAQSTLLGVSAISSISSISSLISTVQSHSLQLALGTRSVANATAAFSGAQAAASSSALAPYIYAALANYASSASSIQPPPSAPTGLTSSAVTSSGFTVRWQGFTAASSYTFVLNGQEVTPASQTSLSATFSGLTSSTQYSVIVRAVNSKGIAPSAPFTVTTSNPAPTLPVLSLTNVTESTAQISWTGGLEATSYSYSLNGISTTPIVDSGLSSKFIVLSGLTAQTTYNVVVTATNANGSTASVGFPVTTSGPPTILRLSSSAPVKSGFTLNWTGGENAASFSFVLNGSVVTPTVSGSSAVFTGLLPSTSYTVVMTATNTLGSTSATMSVTTGPAVFKGYWSPSIIYEVTDLVIKGADDRYDARVYSCLVAGAGNNPLTGNSWSVGSSYLGIWLTVWNSGGYPQGVSVMSPLDFQLYLCSTATAGGAQDPSLDTTNWQLIGLAGGAPSPFVVDSLSVEQGGFSMGWTGGAGATSYVFVLNGVLVVPSTDNSLTSQSVSFTGLTSGEEYNIAAFAVNANGSYCPMSFAIIMLPSVPVLTASSISPTSFDVTWTSLGALSYSYSITDLSGGTYTPSTDNGVSGKNISVTGLTPTTTYIVVVTAVNQAGSAASDPLTVTTLVIPPPPTQPVLSTTVTSDTITASWTGGSGATSYTYVLNGSSVTPSTDNGVSGNNAVFTGLASETPYTLVVTAINGDGSVASDPITVTTLRVLSPPTKPVLSTSVTSDTITASWTGGSGATSYTYVLNGSSVTPSTDNGVSGNNAVFTDLVSETPYTLLVTAINGDGSVASDPITVTTLIFTYPPTQPVVTTTVTSNTITASWTGGSGATSYSYVLNGSSVTPSTNNGVSGKNAVFTGLTPLTSYSLVVTATNSIGSTSGSGTVTTSARPTVQYNGPMAKLSFNNTTNTTATATWTGCAANTEYTYSVGFGVKATVDASTNTALITGLNPRTTYPFTLTGISPVSTPVFIAATGAPSALQYSYDGVTWSTITSGSALVPQNYAAVSVAYNGEFWIAGTNATNSLIYSSNGFNWSVSTSGSALFTGGCLCAAWNGVLWVAGGKGANRMAYSYDGINWTPSASGNSLFTDFCKTVAWNGSIWVAAGKLATVLAYSYDGISWTASASGNALYPNPARNTDGIVSSVAWSATSSMWVAAGSFMAYSYDGIQWTAAANRILIPAYSLATNGSIWVAGGANGRTYQLIYSTDGINWISSTSGNSLLHWQCDSVAWNGSVWVASGTKYGGAGGIIYSSDGITWTDTSYNLQSSLVSICSGNGSLLTSQTANIKMITENTDPNSFTSSSITSNSFVVSWSGGAPSITYAYTLNGVSTTPSSVTTTSATFTGLTPSTVYQVSVTSTYASSGINVATSSIIVKLMDN
jgi:hypothetical protein